MQAAYMSVVSLVVMACFCNLPAGSLAMLTMTPVPVSAGLSVCLLGTHAQPCCCWTCGLGAVAAAPLPGCQIQQLLPVPMHYLCQRAAGTHQNSPKLLVQPCCQFTCSGWPRDLVYSLSPLCAQ